VDQRAPIMRNETQYEREEAQYERQLVQVRAGSGRSLPAANGKPRGLTAQQQRPVRQRPPKNKCGTSREAAPGVVIHLEHKGYGRESRRGRWSGRMRNEQNCKAPPLFVVQRVSRMPRESGSRGTIFILEFTHRRHSTVRDGGRIVVRRIAEPTALHPLKFVC